MLTSKALRRAIAVDAREDAVSRSDHPEHLDPDPRGIADTDPGRVDHGDDNDQQDDDAERALERVRTKFNGRDSHDVLLGPSGVSGAASLHTNRVRLKP
jgi:hypothetical protein